MDIMGAEHLAVTEDHQSGRVAETVTNFYKVTADGSLEAIKYVYPDGGVADSTAYNNVQVSVSQVYNLTEEYVLLYGFFIWPDTLGKPSYYNSILVRKADGVMYDFGVDNKITRSDYRGDDAVKKDAVGNIYVFLNGDVSKLQLDDSELISITSLLPSGQYARHFEISYDGLLMYEYGQTYNDFRIKKPDGGIYKVDLAGRVNRSFWRGINGALYLLTANDFGTAIHKITLVEGEITINDVWAGNENIGWYGYSNEKIVMESSILFINPEIPQSSWEFSEVDNSVRKIDLPFAEYNSKLIHSDNYYYIATSDALYKIDKSNHSYTTLLAPNMYEVYAMSVDNNDKVRFSGLRFKDGRKVFAEIDKNGVLTTIDEELNQAAKILQKIN